MYMCSHEHAHSLLETVYWLRSMQVHVATVQISCVQNKLTITMHTHTSPLVCMKNFTNPHVNTHTTKISNRHLRNNLPEKFAVEIIVGRTVILLLCIQLSFMPLMWVGLVNLSSKLSQCSLKIERYISCSTAGCNAISCSPRLHPLR